MTTTVTNTVTVQQLQDQIIQLQAHLRAAQESAQGFAASHDYYRDLLRDADDLRTRIRGVEYVITGEDSGHWEIHVSKYEDWEDRFAYRQTKCYEGDTFEEALEKAVEGDGK